MPAGHYNIVARRVGFRTVSRLSVVVTAGAIRKVDFELQPGSVFQTITVSGLVTPPVETGSRGEIVVRPADAQGLPDIDRTVTGLLREAPGLLFTPANGGEPGQASSLGARPDSNSYLVDGLSANNAVAGGGWPSFLPVASLPAMSALGTTHDLAVLDAIQEVSIDPQGLGAGTNQAAGAIIVIRTQQPGAASPCPIRLPPNRIHQDHGYCSTSITDVPPSVNVLGSPGQCTGGVAVALLSTWMNSRAWLPVPVHFAVACAWV